MSKQIQQVIKSRARDIGGFSVRRLLPTARLRNIGPWVFLDHLGPTQLAAGEEFNVLPHPHIGLATVTYLFAGEMLHRDSLATEQLITPGAINLMYAGSGIVHSERQRPETAAQDRELHGLQLWFALPEELEQMPPAFYHYPSEAIPATEIDGVKVRLLIGKAYGLESPVHTVSETLYAEAFLAQGQSLELPASEELAVYVVSGELTAKDETLTAHSLVAFDTQNAAKDSDVNSSIKITAQQDSQIAILGGKPVGRRYMEWNFVASNRELLEQAKANWQAGKFAKVPGDEEEFVPLPS